jgi:hypothetical protein
MGRVAGKVDESASVERLVKMPGWVYNLFIERATKERRLVKNQIEMELERLAEKYALQQDPR